MNLIQPTESAEMAMGLSNSLFSAWSSSKSSCMISSVQGSWKNFKKQ